MIVRKVTSADAKAITAIYNYYIENTIITFEEEPVSTEAMTLRIETISAKYPYLVIEHEGEVIGYAYVTEWKTRSAYRYSAEDTIYLDHRAIGKGAGRILFSALLDEVKNTNLHSIVGGISLPNSSSIALHEKSGFKKIGQFEEIGLKFGNWIDVAYWELKI
jgi:L-amino acid N-acyltransferase YncA